MLHISGLTPQQVHDERGRAFTRYGLQAHVLLSKDRVALLLMGALFITSVVVALVSDNNYEWGDSITHYLYAHWAWQHPENFLNTWAKPLFTLLAAGPSYFGFQSLELFQCGIVAWSAWLAYTIARRLALPAPALAILFCYAAPDYFRIQFSGLTEPLFGLILVGAVSLALHGRYRWSAIVLSWLPLVRSEGIALWGLWVAFLAIERQWRALPWLALGMGLYSLVGGFFLDYNFAWLFTNSPYSFHSQYGSGHWRHFIDHLPSLLGWVLTLLLALGIAFTVRRMARPAEWRQPLFRGEILLLDGSIVLFTLVQSILWAYGLFGSFGMLRTMTVLVPLLVVVCLRGLASLSELASRQNARRWVLAAGTLLVVGMLFTRDIGFRRFDGELIGLNGNLHWRRDFLRPGDVQVSDAAAAWLQKYDPHWRWHPLAYEQLSFPMALDSDIFDPTIRIPLTVNYSEVSNLEGLPVGTYVYWDDFWASGSGQLRYDIISKDPRFKKLWAGECSHSAYDTQWKRHGVLFERVK